MSAIRLLWTLPKAVPALLRHAAGYAELVGQDLERMHKDLGARLVAAAVFGLSMFFVLCLVCLLVVALTWNTPNRVVAIGWMIAVFVLIAASAGLYRSKVAGGQGPIFSSVRHEWQEDRAVVDHIMSRGDQR